MSNILTCVYCGSAYPEGAPPHSSQILTDHIKICEKHPLREAEMKIKKLRKVLIELVGESEKQKLEEMEIVLRTLPIPDKDRTAMINAIHVLIETE